MTERMPTAEEAGVLAFLLPQDSYAYVEMRRGVMRSCAAERWIEPPSHMARITDSGRAALARYREAHEEGRG